MKVDISKNSIRNYPKVFSQKKKIKKKKEEKEEEPTTGQNQRKKKKTKTKGKVKRKKKKKNKKKKRKSKPTLQRKSKKKKKKVRTFIRDGQFCLNIFLTFYSNLERLYFEGGGKKTCEPHHFSPPFLLSTKQ